MSAFDQTDPSNQPPEKSSSEDGSLRSDTANPAPDPTIDAVPFETADPDITVEVNPFATRPVADAQQQSSPSGATVPENAATEANEVTGMGAGSVTETGGLPRRFGDYMLLEVIAHGGMGIVFKARQRSLNRTVALKMILSGQLATPDLIQRFFIEAEASAQLDHPNIVAVYEVGTCQGQHFFSMAFVEGQSLADLAQDGPLSSRRAAELLVQVTEAIEYAHSKGIIHRDLKPANILLDEDGVPKVTDFGLAKMSTSSSQVTATGQIMGTPSYMPPEQASGKLDSVGPLADVYSLGAILYCLMTGRPPFQSAQILETLKQVVECDPVAPRQLNMAVSRDLENICLKCLQKSPAARYPSAAELAADLHRFLNGEPVHARPVGMVERARRWCVRNPIIASLTAAVAVALISGTVVSTYFAIAANQRAAEAERNLAQARKAVDGLYLRVSEHTLLNQPGLQPIRHELLAEALQYYEWFLQERSGDPSIREELALNHFRVGLITEEIKSPEVALQSYQLALTLQQTLLDEQPGDVERRRAVADTLTAMGRAAFRNADLETSLSSYRRALEERRALSQQRPQEPEFQRLLANANMNLGLLFRDSGDLERTREHLHEANALRRLLLERAPTATVQRDLAQGLYNLGNFEFDSGEFELAIAYFTEAAELFELVLTDQPQDLNLKYRSALCRRRLGDLLQSAERTVAATDHYREAVAQLRLLTLRNPDVPIYHEQFGQSCRALGELLFESDRQESLRLLSDAETTFETLLASASDPVNAQFELAVVLRLKGLLLEDEPGRESIARSEHLFEGLLRKFPEDAMLQEELELTRELLTAPADDR